MSICRGTETAKPDAMRDRSRKSGFSLVELLIGMFLALILYSVTLGPTKEYLNAKKLQGCAENLRKLHMSLTLYANEHDGAFPGVPGARTANEALAPLVPQYSSDTSLFTCPAPGQSGYAYVMGLRKDVDGGTMLASDAQVNPGPKQKGEAIFPGKEKGPAAKHGQGNVLFVDGHVEAFGDTAPRDLPLPQGAQVLNPTP